MSIHGFERSFKGRVAIKWPGLQIEGCVSTGLIATGTTISDAFPLSAQYNLISTSSSGSGIILPGTDLVGHGLVLVVNSSLNDVKVYSRHDTINGTAGSTGVLLPQNDIGFYFSTGAGAYSASNVLDPMPVGGNYGLIGKLLSADMNLISDQPIQMLINTSSLFRVEKITVTNASDILNVVTGGIYTDINKGGTAIVANTQNYSSLLSPNSIINLTILTTPGNTIWDAGTSLYLSLSTPQNASVTADFYVYGTSY